MNFLGAEVRMPLLDYFSTENSQKELMHKFPAMCLQAVRAMQWHYLRKLSLCFVFAEDQSRQSKSNNDVFVAFSETLERSYLK